MILLNNLAKSYHNHPIFSMKQSIEINEGITVIIGKKGAGKTTLLKMFIGLEQPDYGQILYPEGLIHDVKDKMGVVFDKIPTYPNLTGFDYLKYFNTMRNHPMTVEELFHLMKEWDIPVNKQKLSTYSYCMTKRLGIAQALIGDPKYLFLDEPFFGVNYESKMNVIQLLKGFREQGKTVILITQDFEAINAIADHLLILHNQTLNYIPNIKQYLSEKTIVKIVINRHSLPEDITKHIINMNVEENRLSIEILKKSKQFILTKLANYMIPVLEILEEFPTFDKLTYRSEGRLHV